MSAASALMHTPYNNQVLSHSCACIGLVELCASMRTRCYNVPAASTVALPLATAPAFAHSKKLQHQCRRTYPVPLHFLSWLLRPGSVTQLQQKPKQQQSFMKRRMRSE